MEIWVARVVRVAAVVKVIFSQYRGLLEIRVARVVRVAAVVRLIFSHTGGYGNTGSKGSQSSSSSQSHILTYRGLWKYG